jgi:hypothetical protein
MGVKLIQVFHDIELDNREIVVRFAIGARDFSLLQNVQTCRAQHLFYHSLRTGTNSSGVKAAWV